MHERRACSITVRCGGLLGLLALGLAACSDTSSGRDGSATPPFVEAADLPRIREQRVLRVLVPSLGWPSNLPRKGSSLDGERELVEDYARRIGVSPFWVYVDSRDELIPALLAGRGDLIAANLTATADRRRQVAFTVPLATVREQVVTRAADVTIHKPADLEGRRVIVRRSSSFWPTLQELQGRYPGIEILEAPEDVETEELIHRVAQRSADVTVADSNLIKTVLAYRDDVRAACDLTRDRPIAWAVRPSSPALLRSLNRFLTDAQLGSPGGSIYLGDLDEIKEHRVLRVLTRNSAATYFLWRNELMGFEYELAKRFAEEHGLRIQVVVPPRSDDLLPWLMEGRGDVVAAALTPTEEPQAKGVVFCAPYTHASRVLVTRSDDDSLASLADLTGRTVAVRESSAHWVALEQLRADGIPIELRPVPGDVDPEEIIAMVADGAYDLTVANSHILDIELAWRDDVRAAFTLAEAIPLAWAVRPTNPQLKAAIDAFVQREYRGEFYNVIYRKYFKDPRKMRRHAEHRVSGSSELSPYDDLVKRHAHEHGFDWRMIVALMYQESQFDPNALSFSGAVGLLQVLPTTAQQMGLADIEDPETNIVAGIRYLAWLRDRFPEDLAVLDRMWFTLAAYNVGHGHVLDARRVAEEQGWNPNRWFGHVERAMLLLSRPDYASRTSHGYCRGSEPVKYVNEIKSRYEAYREIPEPASRSRAAVL